MEKKDFAIIAVCVIVMIWGMQHFAPRPIPADQALYEDDQPLPGQMTPTSLAPTPAVGTGLPAGSAALLDSDFAGLEPLPPVTLSLHQVATYTIDAEAGGLSTVVLDGLDITVGHPDEPMYAVRPASGAWQFSHARVLDRDDRRLRVARQVAGLPLVVEQSWSLDPEQPYQLAYELRLRNTADTQLDLPEIQLQAGTMEDLGTPRGFMGAAGIDQRIDLRFTGKKSPSTYPLDKVRKLDAEDMDELETRPLDWVAVQNKYFATITSQTGGQPIDGILPSTQPVLSLAVVPDEASSGWRGEVYRLSKKDPALTVTLSSSDPDAVSIPSSVVIPARAQSATFAVSILDPAVGERPEPVRLEATAAGLARGMTTFPPPPLAISGVHVAEDLLLGHLRLLPDSLAPHASQTWSYDIYLGPKQFERLKALGDNKVSLMQFDLLLFFHLKMFESISRLILWGMTEFHSIFNSYGIAIILITFILRLVFWPITHKSTVMSRKMQQIAPLAKELREKYGSDPQKLHQKTMELYKEYKINPLSGCLPALLQIPAFFALYNVLRSAIELRHASFLWAADLSLPDTVGYLFGLPINPLAIVMAATMFIHMKIVPTGGDPNQQRIMMIMSMSFLIFLYTMPSGLTLYWAANQILNIIQYRITHQMMDRSATPSPAKA